MSRRQTEMEIEDRNSVNLNDGSFLDEFDDPNY
jgi:hypothetical protein